MTCQACGSDLLIRARFCSVCGATVSAATDTSLHEICEVVWWRGYLKSRFYAVARRAGEEPVPVGASGFFRWRRSSPPPGEGAIAQEHDGLMARLRADGWVQIGRGARWYDEVLERRGNGRAELAPVTANASREGNGAAHSGGRQGHVQPALRAKGFRRDR
jgi:hypothetical protein